MTIKTFIKAWLPPVLYNFFRKIKDKENATANNNTPVNWSEHHELLDWWGKANVWNEIQMLLINCSGKVLDVGCGTGAAISILSNRKDLDLFGCDISEELIARCIKKGIAENHLQVCSATNMGVYTDNTFDYSYSIGLLHYIEPAKMPDFVSETYRITRNIAFHNAPVSESEKDEGWIHSWHRFQNNSTASWVSHFEKKFSKVTVIDSAWNDKGSKGKWFICYK